MIYNTLPDIISDAPIFLVPSIIHLTHPDKSRSIYSATERFDHSIKQLKSIKQYYPNSVTILLECSQSLTDKELVALELDTDAIYLFHTNSNVMTAAHTVNNRNYTEILVLLHIIRELSQVSTLNCSHICKFGGRYWFNNPSPDLFQDKPLMKHGYVGCYDRICTESVFYSIPLSYIMSFYDHLLWMLNEIQSVPVSIGNEELLTFYLHGDTRGIKTYESSNVINYEPPFGIEGYQAPTGVFRRI